MQKSTISILVILMVLSLSLEAQRVLGLKMNLHSCARSNYPELLGVMGHGQAVGLQAIIVNDVNDQHINSFTMENKKVWAAGVSLRGYTQNALAIRFGIEFQKINYSSTLDYKSLSNVSFDATRRDVVVTVGLEKHFPITMRMDYYIGPIIPITLIGDSEYLNGTGAGLETDISGYPFIGGGLVTGINVEFLRVMRFGAEFYGTYSKYKYNVTLEDLESRDMKYGQLDISLRATLGISI